MSFSEQELEEKVGHRNCVAYRSILADMASKKLSGVKQKVPRKKQIVSLRLQ